MEHYLLIDLGTGSTRAAVVNSQGEILGMRSFFNHYYRDEAYPDAQYFLPEEWEAEILECCRELHAAFPEIRIQAVSSAGARQTIVLLDRNRHAFYALPNIDNRGTCTIRLEPFSVSANGSPLSSAERPSLSLPRPVKRSSMIWSEKPGQWNYAVSMVLTLLFCPRS